VRDHSEDPVLVLVRLAMLDAGLVPVIPGYYTIPGREEEGGRPSLEHLKFHLAQLTPEARRVACRKFRKAWHRALREYQQISYSPGGLGRNHAVRKLRRLGRPPGAGHGWRPKRSVLRERMHEVYSYYLRLFLLPEPRS